VLAVQQPIMACSSVTGRFGLSGWGTLAPGGIGIGSRTDARRALGTLWDDGVMGRFKCMQDAVLRCCVAAVCELQRVESGRSGWIEPGNGIQVSVPRVVVTALTSCKPRRRVPVVYVQPLCLLLLWSRSSSCP
jgi:hypothetical protein